MTKSSGILRQVTLVLFMSMMFMSFSPGGQAKMSCDTVFRVLSKCINFLLFGEKDQHACCSRVKTVISLAKSKIDRQSVCSCLKFLLQGFLFMKSRMLQESQNYVVLIFPTTLLVKWTVQSNILFLALFI